MKRLKNFCINIISNFFEILRNVLITLIKTYQLFISPMSSPCCRFTPTCSQYSKEAFEQFNIFKAFYLSVLRIIKCNPFSNAKYDPLPNKGKI